MLQQAQAWPLLRLARRRLPHARLCLVAAHTVHRRSIIDGFIDQAGAQTESVFGGQFKDDPGGLSLKHDRKVRATAGTAAAASSSRGGTGPGGPVPLPA